MTADIVIDCSVPPSANRLWRVGKGRVYRSQKYQRWLWEFRVALQGMSREPLEGPFIAEILICPKRKRDCDNTAKGLLDACQKMGIIANDSQAIEVNQKLVDKSQAPLGCRLRITPLGS